MSTSEQHYHFSLGNSTEGPIGFCAEIVATSRQEAIAILQEALPESVPIRWWAPTRGREDRGSVQYIRVYFNAEAIRAADIDECLPA